MDWNLLQWWQYLRWVPTLAASHDVGTELRRRVMTGAMLAGAILMLLVATGAMPNEAGEVALDAYREGILQAHPEWPPDIRAALLAGIICAGMPADMVRVAWGYPTWTSSRTEPGQHEIWYYAGRPSAIERLTGRGTYTDSSSEWTVSFINGQVVAWTD